MDKETTTSVTIDRKTFARLDRLAKSNNVGVSPTFTTNVTI